MAQLYRDPNADGLYTAWTANTGNRWDCVNDAGSPDADTTYITVATTGSRSTFYVPNVTSGEIPDNAVINWVEIQSRAEKTVSQAANLGHCVANASTYYDGGDSNALTQNAYNDYTYRMTLDPVTGQAWAVNTLRNWQSAGSVPRSFGVKAGSSRDMRCTQIRVLIDYVVNTNLAPSVATLTLSTATPTVTTTENHTGTPTAGSLNLSGQTPTVDVIQRILPVSDTYVDQWTTHTGATTGLYDEINEVVANPSDYAQSPDNPTGQAFVWHWQSVQDPQSNSGHVIRLRIRKDQAGGPTLRLIHQLRQGYTNESSLGTLIRGDTFTDVSETEAEVTATLTAGEADSITDYTALYSRVVAEVV